MKKECFLRTMCNNLGCETCEKGSKSNYKVSDAYLIGIMYGIDGLVNRLEVLENDGKILIDKEILRKMAFNAKQYYKESANEDNNTSGHMYKTAEFIKLVIDGFFTRYDGNGFFHDGVKETDISVWDDSLSFEQVQSYPFVCWHNK